MLCKDKEGASCYVMLIVELNVVIKNNLCFGMFFVPLNCCESGCVVFGVGEWGYHFRVFIIIIYILNWYNFKFHPSILQI